ncbi:MAG: flagellar filament capping protein FliD [Burkholderiales bacterium]|nr:flagellar filament capping protein FliD [Burkholderiales bacterium]
MAVSLPGISATSGTLTASGVGSGIDIKGLVSQLMAVEQRPLTLLAQKESDFQFKLTSLGSVQGSLSSLQSAAQALAAASTATYGASASDTTILSATADSTAASGSYSVSVTALAQVQKLVSPTGQASTTAAIGTGAATTLTLTLGTITGTPVDGQYASAGFDADPLKTPVTLTIDSSNNTLAGIRDAINAAGAGVTASIINDGSGSPYRLTLTSNATGAASSMKLSVAGDAAIASLLEYDPTAPAQNFNETQTAQDVTGLVVNGVAIASATNSVAGAIQGVTLNLAKPTTSGAVTVTVQRDNSKLTSALGALVNAYNSANKTIAAATAKGAVLQGDWAVLSLQRQVRTILGSAQSAGGAYTTLSQLGVSFQKDGTLALDSAKLNTALSANVGDVAALAAAIGGAVKSTVDDLLGPTGPITNETAGINRSIKDIGSQRINIQSRLDATEARYQAQFNALDTLLSSMNSMSSFLSQQLDNLPNYYNTQK